MILERRWAYILVFPCKYMEWVFYSNDSVFMIHGGHFILKILLNKCVYSKQKSSSSTFFSRCCYEIIVHIFYIYLESKYWNEHKHLFKYHHALDLFLLLLSLYLLTIHSMCWSFLFFPQLDSKLLFMTLHNLTTVPSWII